MIVLKNALVILATLVSSLNDVIVRADDEDGDNELVNLVENMNDFFLTESAITNSEEFRTDNSKTIRDFQKSRTVQNAGAKQAFVICNHDFGADGSIRVQQIREATGNEELELSPIYNQDDKSCYLSSITSDEMTPLLSMNYITAIYLSKEMKIKAGTLYGISTRMAQDEADANRPISFHMKMNVVGNDNNIGKVLSKAVAHAEEVAQEGCETFYEEDGESYVNFDYEVSKGNEFVLTWSLPIVEHVMCLKQLIVYATECKEIEFVEMKPLYEELNFAASYILQGGSLSGTATPFWDNGIQGQDQIVQVSDTGLDTSHCFFVQEGDVKKNQSGAWEPDKRKVVQYFSYVDTTDYNQGHGTHVAGTVNGYASSSSKNKGMAYESKLAIYDIGDGQGYLRLPTSKQGWYKMLEVAHKITNTKKTNANIHSASWGAQTSEYNSDSAWFDGYTFENPNFLTFIAAGNSGPSSRSIGAPATAKNIISVGAVNRGSNADTLISWSSRGPTSDGRIGPMVVAPGVGTDSSSAKNKKNGNCDTVEFSGTSMATPATAGAAALVRQYFKEGWYGDGTKGSGASYEATAALLKAVLLNGAQKISSFNNYDNNQGYGRVSLYHSIPLKKGGNSKIKFMKKEESIENKKSKVYDITMSNPAGCADLRMTLVWTDEAAQSGCSKCLVNDLDFTAQVNDGNAVYPNGKKGKDSKNNAERIIITGLKAKDKVKMTVFGANLNREKMDFALVAVGCFGDVQTGPTPVPKPDTPQPSKKPVTTPAPNSQPPAPAPNEAPSPQGCVDDFNFKFKFKGVKRDCMWIFTEAKQSQKKKVCKKAKIKAKCPMACDLCEEETPPPVPFPTGGPGPEPGPCKDDKNFKFQNRTCKQISNRFGDDIQKMFEICWSFTKDNWVYGSCKATCKYCTKKGSNCCAASYDGRIGCKTKKCQKLVCKQDDFCCDVTWDLFCQDVAMDVCDICNE